MLLQPLVFLLQRPKQRRSCRLLLPLVAGCATAEASPPPTTPNAGQAIPPLTHTPCYSAVMAASHRSRTSEPSYSSPRGHPLPRLPRLHVVPFLGLAAVHRRGALGAAWSMWSTTNFHRKSTVRGEADSWVQAAARKCLLITHKIIIPPPDSRDPPDEPPYFVKKNVSPDCWDPPATSSHARKCLLITQKKMNTPYDEDINTIVTPTAPAAIHTGPITRARARQLNYQVL